MKKLTIIVALAIVIVIIGVYYFTRNSSDLNLVGTDQTASTTASSTDQTSVIDKTKTIIGQSIEKRDVVAYHYGAGGKEILFVGGIHGGYEWNTVLLAYELMDYLKANPNVVPKNLKVTIVPVLNPDGLVKVVGVDGPFSPANVSTDNQTVIAGRLNANRVDLNRNFDCGWQAQGVWQKTPVSGGSQAFSESESLAFKNYVESHNPSAVVVWYSSAGGIFASQCDNGILAETRVLADTYAKASGYQAHDNFDFYETTGDVANWLAKKGIPAVSVILATHTDTEWSKNLAGVGALLEHYGK